MYDLNFMSEDEKIQNPSQNFIKKFYLISLIQLLAIFGIFFLQQRIILNFLAIHVV